MNIIALRFVTVVFIHRVSLYSMTLNLLLDCFAPNFQFASTMVTALGSDVA